MKCPKCGGEIEIQVATKVGCKKCRILTEMTIILTVQCEHCNHIFQLPIGSKRFVSVKDKNN